MTDIDREATLREVLGQVSLLDLGATIRSMFATLGCLGAFFLLIALLGKGLSFWTGMNDGLGIPDWAYWLFLIWMFLAIAPETRVIMRSSSLGIFPRLVGLAPYPYPSISYSESSRHVALIAMLSLGCSSFKIHFGCFGRSPRFLECQSWRSGTIA